ncbi:MAG TPA: hypothetical protein VF158_11225 [Longimicrobiales bacterium]
MDPSAIPVFLAGPFPVLHRANILDREAEVQLDVGLIIGGMPTILAATTFPLDDTWERVEAALSSGDARLGVAGVPHEVESAFGEAEVFPSAYVGLECANGERLILAHIRGPDRMQNPEMYARDVISALLNGQTPAELGELIED